MQPQISREPAVRPAPRPAEAPPRQAPRQKQTWIWIVSIVVVGLLGGLAYYWRTLPSNQPVAMHVFPTATVAAGRLDRILRLSGTTGSANFAGLITPQLRGSRSGYHRDAGAGSASSVTSPTIQSKQGGNTSPGASSGNTPNMSSAMQQATSRIAAPSKSTTSASTGTAATTASTAMGTDGLGSTSGELVSGGGLGGGGDDFGLTLQRLVQPGIPVKKGDKVAEFDRQYMLLRLEDYRSSVVQADADLGKLKADLMLARKIKEQDIATAKGDYDKAVLDMKTLPVLSQLDAERARLALSEAEAKYKQLRADLKPLDVSQQAAIRNSEIELQQTRIELRRAEANADRMVLKAPISGLAVMQTIWRGGDMGQVREGDQLWPGMMFMTVVDTRSMVVNATINQVDVESLRIGQKATVHFDAYPDLVLPATVYSIGGVPKPSGQRASFVKEIAVRLKLENTDPRVIPDLSVSAEVVTGSEENAAITPLSSIFRDDRSRRPYVYVRTAEGWTPREVDLGLANNLAVAVRDGAKAGDVVALEPPPKNPQM
jgi:multidrug resistance efflux pump